MDKITSVFIFYVLLIVGISVAIFVASDRNNKMIYSLFGMVAGVIISYVLWISFGKSYSEKV